MPTIAQIPSIPAMNLAELLQAIQERRVAVMDFASITDKRNQVRIVALNDAAQAVLKVATSAAQPSLTNSAKLTAQTPFGWPQEGHHSKPEPFDLARFEYAITENARKQDSVRPEGDGWQSLDWVRHDLTEEVLWRRLR